MLKYVGYKLKDESIICSLYLHEILARGGKVNFLNLTTPRKYWVWEWAICTKSLYQSEVFQELISRNRRHI